MTFPATRPLVVGLLLGSLLLSGCGDSEDSDSPPGGEPTAAEEPTATTGDDTAGDDATGVEACELLDEAEVEAAIGEHLPGEQDYALGGCVWQSTDPPTADTGFVPSVTATTLSEGEYEQLAEIGEPISGFGDGATYDETSGELWFPCADGQWCGIKAGIADADERQPIAESLARALQSRVE